MEAELLEMDRSWGEVLRTPWIFTASKVNMVCNWLESQTCMLRSPFRHGINMWGTALCRSVHLDVTSSVCMQTHIHHYLSGKSFVMLYARGFGTMWTSKVHPHHLSFSKSYHSNFMLITELYVKEIVIRRSLIRRISY